MNSFSAVKRLRTTLTLSDQAATKFDSTGNNTLVIDDLRATAVVQSNARQATQMNLQIWGMRLSDMDAMTAAWIDPFSVRNNRVTLEADSGNGFRPVFKGMIIEAQPDFKNAPEVPFQILSLLPGFQQIEVADPLSYDGSVGIDVIGRHLAAQLGLSYDQTPGLTAALHNPYFPGSIWDQLTAACKAANVDYYFLGDQLVFTPLNVAFKDKPAVILSPTTGLLGYPVYSRRGLTVTAIYDPAFQCGVAVEVVDSLVKGANGRWYPYAMEHSLDARRPGGKWTTVMHCNRAGV